MSIDAAKIRSYRMRAHHLDHPIPSGDLIQAAGVCGWQNSPPGAWETAAFNRLSGCTLSDLQAALYEQKSLLQAWSYRGVPVVFPAAQSAVFLSPLVAQAGEEPWIYTRGITLALDYVQMSFADLLPQVKAAAAYLNTHTIASKEALDRTLADIVAQTLPAEKQKLWNAPSMYGSPDKQTVGGAIVSFMLRPCSFSSLVVFGRREGSTPTFTAMQNWLGHPAEDAPNADKALARKYLHCFAPATVQSFHQWLGCSPRQAKRIWGSIAGEMAPVTVAGKTCFVLAADWDTLQGAEDCGDRLLLLGAHDPYLELRDRQIILPDAALHKSVWKTVANPGVILEGGRIIGTWQTKTSGQSLTVTMTLFAALTAKKQQELTQHAEEYAAFRQLALKKCSFV